MAENYVEDRNLSVAWARAVQLATAPGRAELTPLVVAITGFDRAGNFEEDGGIRAALDTVLTMERKQSVATVANTIFPLSLWNSEAGRNSLFDRYQRLVPRLRRRNRYGLYFERMINGGPAGKGNQLDFAISTYLSRKGVRRSVLQLGVFNPNLDHSTSAQRGFPCLQHVTFVPTKEGLQVNAFYATQYLIERAYGNYVGLCRLGRFAAHEMKLPLIRLTCFTGIAECDVPKNRLTGVAGALSLALGPRKSLGE